MFAPIRIRLVLLSLVVIATVGGGVAWYMRLQVRANAHATLDAHLTSTANAAAALVSTAPAPQTAIAAMQYSDGTLLRFARTIEEVNRELPTSTDFHAATAPILAQGAPIGYVVASRTTDEIQRSLDRFDRGFLVAAMLALLVSIFMGWAATALVGRSMRKLVSEARDVARGTVPQVPTPTGGDEFSDLRGWFNYIAQDAQRSNLDFARGRALLTSVLDSMSHGVIATDANGVVEGNNHQAQKILGLNAPLIGRKLAECNLHPTIMSAGRAAASTTSEFVAEDGTHVAVRVGPKRDTGGVVIVIEDVTKVRELETIRKDFVANVSHELRTPVAVIRANAETLSAGALAEPEVAAKLVSGLHRNAERLARILADLLDLSRLDAGQYRLDQKAVGLRECVDTVVTLVGPSAEERNIDLQIEVDSKLVVFADTQALEQVLVNLVDNAIKYGSSPGHIWVRSMHSDGKVVIEVADDGPGIDLAAQKRIFERFYRVDTSRSREAGGTGLGLSIVKHLVESMGGQVTVRSGEPKGLVFSVELPTPPPSDD